MRDAVVRQFSQKIKGHLDNSFQGWIAVVGGSLREPELESLAGTIASEYSVKTFGVDQEADFFLDLNEEAHRVADFSDPCGLILCSQVLEHVWNHHNAFKALEDIASKGTLLWLAFPASNIVHGSPHYYSAGFTEQFAAKNLASRGWKIIDSGSFSSRRNYLARHAKNLWLSEAETKRPFRYLSPEGTSLAEKINRVRYFLWPLIWLSLQRESTDPKWAVESWVLAQR